MSIIDNLDLVLVEEKELVEHYNRILKEYKLREMDELVLEYEKEIKASEGQMSNERIRHYLGMFAFYAYVLNANISRHSLRSDVSKLMEEQKESGAYINSTHDGQEKKMTREERQAFARLGSVDEAKVAILFTSVTKAVEGRIWAFNKLIETLNILSAMNMSEAKLGGKQ